MQISTLAKKLGVKSKEVKDFLNSKGADYKSHMNKVTPDEEAMVKKHFSSEPEEKKKDKVTTIIRRKVDKTDDEGNKKKVLATIIRKKGESHTFIPEDDIAAQEEEQAESESVESETGTDKAVEQPDEAQAAKAPVTAEEITESEKQQTDDASVEKKHEAPSDETAEKKPEEELKKEEESLLSPHHKVEKQEKTIVPQVKKKDDQKKSDSDEHAKKDVKKKKKKIVMVPEDEDAVASKSGKKPAKKFKQATPSHKVKGRIKGGDISQFVEDDKGPRFKRGKKKKDRKQKQQAPAQQANPTKAIKKILKLENTIVVSDLAKKMQIKVADLIKKMMELGEMAGINDRISFDIATILAGEFGFQTENVALSEDTYIEVYDDKEEELKSRPPVVTVMGHVDHGKTKLLDAIRNTNVVDREAGGITQHIGAYTVALDEGEVTFLDTPGHEAFTAMRSRGAQATDIVILIVAADDGVMPQTVEAINHAKAAQVPIIVAINKIDKADANLEKVRQELLKYEIVPEEWGGDHFFVEISAKQRLNIDKLLDAVLLQYEIMELKANPEKPAVGIVIESQMDQGKGPVATTLIKDGTLKIGDMVATGTSFGYIRSMMDWTGGRVDEAGPSNAVEITGLDSVPPAGEFLHVFKDEKRARGIVELRKNKLKEKKFEKDKKVSLENLFSQIEEGEVQDVNIIVKADVDGSVEAINASLTKIEHEKMKVKIIHSGVGGITENDVLLASASNAIVVGFNVRVDNKAKQVASAEQVDIKIFSIIYDLIDSIKSAMSGMLAPIIQEEYTGSVEIRQIFKVSKVGTIAGCMVTDGKVYRKSKIKLIRNNVVIYEGILASLKRFKDDVKEVKSGYECGLSIEHYNDIKEGDIVEAYIDKEIADEVI